MELRSSTSYTREVKNARKRISLTKLADGLMQGGEYKSAFNILKKLFILCDEDRKKLSVCIKLAACCALVHGNISEDIDKDILSLVQKCDLSYSNLVCEANLTGEKETVLHVIWQLYACTCLEFGEHCHHDISRIKKCVESCSTLIKKQKLRISRYENEVAIGILCDIVKLMDVNKVDHSGFRDGIEAKCLLEIAPLYSSILEHEKAIPLLQKGIDIMRNQFKNEVFNVLGSVYFTLLLEMADCFSHIDHIEDALIYFEQAIVGMKTSTADASTISTLTKCSIANLEAELDTLKWRNPAKAAVIRQRLEDNGVLNKDSQHVIKSQEFQKNENSSDSLDHQSWNFTDSDDDLMDLDFLY